MGAPLGGRGHLAFTTPDGERIDLAPGPLWIVYAPR
ncbi:hypothetical protein SBADM41S_11865 [Streptomyces badius]